MTIETLRHAIKMSYLLAVVVFAVLAAVACSSDPTATAEPATSERPASQSSAESGSEAVAMLQLPNIADTVERVRPAVV